jgi:hypothetical protein
MHPIVQGHLKAFVAERELEQEKESRQFEAFQSIAYRKNTGWNLSIQKNC